MIPVEAEEEEEVAAVAVAAVAAEEEVAAAEAVAKDLTEGRSILVVILMKSGEVYLKTNWTKLKNFERQKLNAKYPKLKLKKKTILSTIISEISSDEKEAIKAKARTKQKSHSKNEIPPGGQVK